MELFQEGLSEKTKIWTNVCAITATICVGKNVYAVFVSN